jgi:uncharacterized protein (TIGR02646 family)
MIKLTRKACPNPVKLKTNYKYPENKMALKDSSYGKCMYCESAISHIDHGDVEHIKPKSKYPEETYNWDNLGYACSKCNRDFKKDQYDPNLINPYVDDPKDYLIAIGGIIHAINGNDRGRITILVIQLNRPDILQKRMSSLIAFQDMILRFDTATNPTEKEALKTLIEYETNDDKEYSACKKAFWEAVNQN